MISMMFWWPSFCPVFHCFYVDLCFSCPPPWFWGPSVCFYNLGYRGRPAAVTGTPPYWCGYGAEFPVHLRRHPRNYSAAEAALPAAAGSGENAPGRAHAPWHAPLVRAVTTPRQRHPIGYRYHTQCALEMFVKCIRKQCKTSTNTIRHSPSRHVVCQDR